MATILIQSSFDTEDFWLNRQGAALQSDPTEYRFQNTAGYYVKVEGAGFTYDAVTGEPTGGSYAGITAYSDPAFTTEVATYSSTTGVGLTQFFGGATFALFGQDSISGSGADEC